MLVLLGAMDVNGGNATFVSLSVGAADGLVPNTPISSIKKCLNGDKVVQVLNKFFKQRHMYAHTKLKFHRERYWECGFDKKLQMINS